MAREDRHMGPGRIQSLTDGVYAIAMTILVLGLKVPETAANSPALIYGLLNMQLKLIDMALSFFLLAVFWNINHRHFAVIRRVDVKILWLNLFTLMFVVLIPFSTSVYGEYRGVTAAAIFFEANILILGMLKFWHWSYATKGDRFIDVPLKVDEIRRGRMLNLVTPFVAVIAIMAAFFVPDYSTMLFMLVPVLLTAARKTFPADD